jgi:hypothetical protein
MSDLKKVLMNRYEMTSSEADKFIKELRERVLDEEDPEEVLYEIGLEPDYVLDLI